MSLLPIIIGQDNPKLRVKTKEVHTMSKEILKLLKDMEETTIAAKGAGLAAPQVGRRERVCLAMIHAKLRPLINPKITWKSEAIATAEEGCLSLPEMWLQIPRSREILVEYRDTKGKHVELLLKDFDARVVQHEVDHLEGILIVDYMNTQNLPDPIHQAM